jgi:hypothetical protein
VENAGGHKCNPDGILDLLCRERFPGLVEYARVMGPTYFFEHYAVAPDAVDRDGGIQQQGGASEARAVGKTSSHYIV